MSTATLQLPSAIVTYLTRYARRRRMQRLVRRCGLAALFTLVWMLGWCLLDREFGFAGWVRMTVATLNVVIILLIAAPAAKRLLMRADLVAAAGEVERRERTFAERLRTVVSRALGPARLAGSSSLLAALTDEVSTEVARRRPEELLPWSSSLRPWFACAVVFAMFGALSLVPVLDMPRLVSRYITPLREIAPAATTRLFVTPGDVNLPQGQTLRVRASVQRLGASSLVLHVKPRGQDWSELAMTVDTTDAAGAYEARIANVTRDVEYYVTGGDARSDPFAVRVLRQPAVATFHVSYAYPPYTGLHAKEVVSTDGLLEAPVGTQATIAIEGSEPLSAARVIVGGSAIETTPTGRSAVREAKIAIDADRAFVVRLTSAAGVSGAFRGGRIHALRDRPPVVLIESESRSVTAAGPAAKVAIAYAAADDFGLGRLDAEARVMSGGSSPDRATPIPITGDPRDQRGSVPIDLEPFALHEGDQVEVKLRAEDRAGQFAQSEPLRIVIGAGSSAAAPAPSAPSAAATTRPAADAVPPLIPAAYDDAIRAYFDAIRRRR